MNQDEQLIWEAMGLEKPGPVQKAKEMMATATQEQMLNVNNGIAGVAKSLERWRPEILMMAQGGPDEYHAGEGLAWPGTESWTPEEWTQLFLLLWPENRNDLYPK